MAVIVNSASLKLVLLPGGWTNYYAYVMNTHVVIVVHLRPLNLAAEEPAHEGQEGGAHGLEVDGVHTGDAGGGRKSSFGHRQRAVTQRSYSSLLGAG